MKRIAFTIALLICAAAAMVAQRSEQRTISDADKQKWLSEMRNYKHEMLAKELSLTREQQTQFFTVYDEMEDEIRKISDETRELESKTCEACEADQANDIEIEAAARALFEQKSREGQIEIAYFDKFKEILTPKQLLRLKNAERKFTQQLMRQHGRHKADGQRRK